MLKLRRPKIDKKKTQLDKETAATVINGYSTGVSLITNPDTLVQRRGLDIYDEMLTDDQVYAISATKKLLLLAPSWNILPASASKRDIAIADFVSWNLVNMQGTFRNVLFNVLTAMDYGYSITEKVWTLIKDNRRYRGLVGLKSLKPKSPHYFDFKIDCFGNIKGLRQTVRCIEQSMGDLDPDKFVIYSYNAKFGNPYGYSDLRAAYLPWIEKKLVRRFWNIFLERFGSPPVIGRVPRGAEPDEITKILDIIENIQTRTGITLPEGYELELLEAQRGGQAKFEAAIAEKNMAISHAILMPDLLGFSAGERPGSFALGKAHVDIFLLILEKVSKDIEDDIVGEQIIRPLVDMNFKVQDYPHFKFEPMKRENRSIRAKIISILADAGVIRADEPWVRDFIEIPQVTGVIPETEQETDDPLLERIEKIEEVLAGERPEQLGKPTQRKIGKRIDRAPEVGARAGRGPVEVQSPKL